ncbi:hypothetical protein SU69_07415 [Thermosipho melanesiensis]|uniref:Phage portal protein n=2 Tax=Thermosipho melanesiensis TaxID=46541 RepID=A6LN07_THEM4|nr:phage portal protein [Thermosipho melanesiensis]ABR31308.1 hypothetical protein Tmel_1461 [Thermosipho melanesiensis BI429]APT74383.1 hypothetical protein BW47_07745 [Thermosipho melanesiensis]OOC36330.1 hypothetical protein SU68_07485 [Thermosipho melanesiensis]OOC37148.1 hypothetical protein SU69_07415 [Thermosipho melanesiensis]OOC37900.1 hypothetical protein SU70_07425 [Thermosipho melanesiensis]
MAKKNYQELFDLFYGEYTPEYCQQNQLFIDYDSKNNIKHITKSLIDYAYEIITTDYNLIFGDNFEIYIPNNENATKRLKELFEANNFNKLARLFVIQGLILGDTALKLGRDTDGNVRMGIVKLLNGTLDYVMEYGQVVAWVYEYSMKHHESYLQVKEIYTKDRVQIYVDGKLKINLPNRYGEFWLIHVANIPSLQDPVWGESELERIGDTIDEMNSTLSRISAIEDIYAKPRIIASGIRDASNLRQEHNVWATPDNAELKILEYNGNVIPSMLEKYEKLENYLRNKCPELILNDLGNISGYALKLKLTKLIKKIKNYRDVYFAGIKKACKLALAMDGVVVDEVAIKVDPVIPADEVEDLNKWIMLMQSELVSRQTVAEALGFDFNEEARKIEEENSWYMELMGDESGQKTEQE